MKGTGVEHDERDFAEAWRAFQAEDAALSAPSSVQAAVMAAWHDRRNNGPGERPRSRRVERVAVAAGIVIAIGGAAMFQRARSPRETTPSHRAVALATPAKAGRTSPPAATEASVTPARFDASASNTPSPTREHEPLGVDGEPLQLVRVRMPREALAAFGVSLVEPDATSLVDVELLVADDGMPRGIRHVTAVFNLAERE